MHASGLRSRRKRFCWLAIADLRPTEIANHLLRKIRSCLRQTKFLASGIPGLAGEAQKLEPLAERTWINHGFLSAESRVAPSS
jgi:hypothetical protein